MTSQPRLFILVITSLLISQISFAKTAIEESILKLPKAIDNTGIVEILEGDFFESVQTNSKKYFWTINLKKGPYSTKKEAEKEGMDLKNFIRKSKAIYQQKEIAFSNLLTYSPADDIHPVSRHSFTYCHSFPEIFGIDNGIIKKNEDVVVILTAHGSKFSNTSVEYHKNSANQFANQNFTIPPNLEKLESILSL